MLHNNLHKFQDINEDFHVFSMSRIEEQELLMNHPTPLGYNSIFVETENTRVCSVLSEYDTTTINCICVYMSKDINSNIYE